MKIRTVIALAAAALWSAGAFAQTLPPGAVVGNPTGANAAQRPVGPKIARGSLTINVERFTGVGNTNYTILITDRTIGTNAAFTAPRTWTLPAANAVNDGGYFIVADYQGTITSTNTLTVTRAGADTINGGTSITISGANGAIILTSDGISKWNALPFNVTSAAANTVIGNFTASTATATAFPMPSCTDTVGQHLNYTSGTGVSCGTSVPANVTLLNATGQNVTGGTIVTSLSQSTGNITVDCGTRPLQFISNNGAFTITAPANDGVCILMLTNTASAGAVTFSGFLVGTNIGDALTTVNTSKFMVWIARVNGSTTYRIASLQ